jgi:hypothetical protein
VEFTYAYRGQSAVQSGPYRTQMSFVPDAGRPPTFFSGEIGRAVPFREAVSALHEVVVSDLRTKPKDKSAYKAWAAGREGADLARLAGRRADLADRARRLDAELARIAGERARRWGAFYQARQRYFDYLYKHERDFWYVLDPVVTVHPDEVFFECFSQDESTYGRLSVDYEAFRHRGEIACGTTNVDYSSKLYDEFQKIRSYKSTRLEVDPGGFEVQTGFDDAYREVKIDLPDSWVRGFLQVNSAMTLPAFTFRLHPVDLYNVCFVLRRRRELVGPRSLRFFLRPGEPVRILVEPFGVELACPRSPYEGPAEAEVRVWGRRRLLVLERLLPHARSFAVHLLGTGLPSFYVADLGGMSFTLGLSGWVANDWAAAGNFDLLAPRAAVDDATKARVFAGLKEAWFDEPGRLADRLGVPRATALGALAAYAQAGRAMFDLHKGVYRARELSREPLPLEKLRFSNEREARASRLAGERAVSLDRSARPRAGAGAAAGAPGGRTISGRVRDGARAYEASLQIDGDERIVDGACACNFFQQNRLRKGPCEHQLAVRLAWARS